MCPIFFRSLSQSAHKPCLVHFQTDLLMTPDSPVNNKTGHFPTLRDSQQFRRASMEAHYTHHEGHHPNCKFTSNKNNSIIASSVRILNIIIDGGARRDCNVNRSISLQNLQFKNLNSSQRTDTKSMSSSQLDPRDKADISPQLELWSSSTPPLVER